MEILALFDLIKDFNEVFAGFCLHDNLPGIARIIVFMEGWHWWSDGDLAEIFRGREAAKFFKQRLNVFNDGGFGFVGHSEAKQKCVRRQLGGSAKLEQIIVHA